MNIENNDLVGSDDTKLDSIKRQIGHMTTETQETVMALLEIIDSKSIFLNEPMKKHTSFKIGGPADVLVIPDSVTLLADILKTVKQFNAPLFIMGNGSNLLVSDKGIRGIVIKIAEKFNKVIFKDTEVITESGILLSTLSKEIQAQCLTGFEFASGIPGTVGGGVFMNAGAYDGEFKDIVKWVDVIDLSGHQRRLTNEEMAFAYRRSCLYDTQEIVVACCLSLKKGTSEAIKEKTDDLTFKRTSKQPLQWPSAGSTFKRPEGYFAGKLIDDAGLRGVKFGGAQVSELHCGFVINVDDATCADVKQLIQMIQKVVRDQFQVSLETEVLFIGEA